MAAASQIPGSVSLASDRALNGAVELLEYQFILTATLKPELKIARQAQKWFSESQRFFEARRAGVLSLAIMPKRHGCTSITVLGGSKNRGDYGGVIRKQRENEMMKGSM